MGDAGKILIIDDEKDFVVIVRARLEHEGYDVLEANDGLSGLEVLLRHDVDLILLDIMMPRMDGFTFYKTLHEQGRASPVPPIIAVTAFSSQIESRKCLLGEVPILAKPFDFAVLLRMMREMIDKRKENR